MGFRVLTSTGKVSKSKTTKLRKHLEKACDKIAQVIINETNSFREAALKENLDEHFWMHASYVALLYTSERCDDVYLSSEIGDLFGSPDLANPDRVNTHVDIDRLLKAKEKT